MKLGIRRVAIASVLVIVATLAGHMPSASATGGATGALQGSGTMTPGLTTTATMQTMTMSGTIAGAIAGLANAGTGLYNVSLTASSTSPESVISGTASGSASISGGTLGSASASCTVTITRVGIWTLFYFDCTVMITTPVGTVTVHICFYVMAAAVATVVIPWSAFVFVGLIVGGCA